MADSSKIVTNHHLISTLTKDSLNLELIEITTPSTDSLKELTVKIARLSRSIDQVTTMCDSTKSSTNKTHKESSLSSKTSDTETESPTRHFITVFSIITLATFLIYRLIKK